MNSLAATWWALVVRGVLAILFGLAALLWPGLTLLALVALFGAYAIVDGIFAIVAAVRKQHESWWALLIEGFVGIAAGVVAFVWPGITALALLYLIAAWAVVTGVLEIAAAIRLRDVLPNEWLLVLGGIASVILGLIIAVFPAAGALAVAWIIGVYAMVFGVLLIALGLRLQERERHSTASSR